VCVIQCVHGDSMCVILMYVCMYVNACTCECVHVYVYASMYALFVVDYNRKK
jgi:hypothetical protein